MKTKKNSTRRRECMHAAKRVLSQIFSNSEIGQAIYEALYGTITKRIALLWALTLFTMEQWVVFCHCFSSIIQETMMIGRSHLYEQFGGAESLMWDKTTFNSIINSPHFTAKSKTLLKKLRYNATGSGKPTDQSLDDLRNLKPLLSEIVTFQKVELKTKPSGVPREIHAQHYKLPLMENAKK